MQDERLHDLLERIRGRFKALAATLGVLQDYMPGEGSRGPGEAVGHGLLIRGRGLLM
jgi:hypothetical protein